MNNKAKKDLDEVLDRRKLIVEKGEIKMQVIPEAAFDMSEVDTKKMLEQAAAAEEAKKKNPLDPIVNAFATLGYSPSDAFTMLDDDGDGALTIKEIKDGMSFHKMERVLSDDEWKLFYQMVDENGDGVLTEEEWCDLLEPKVKA